MAWRGGSMALEESQKQEKPKVALNLLLAAVENLELNLEHCRLQIVQIQKGLDEQGLIEVAEIAKADEELAAATSLQEKAEEKLRQLLEARADHGKNR